MVDLVFKARDRVPHLWPQRIVIQYRTGVQYCIASLELRPLLQIQPCKNMSAPYQY